MPLPDPLTSTSNSEGFTPVEFNKWKRNHLSQGKDNVVIEEPIEFRIREESVATVMRTPGDDLDLAFGFFFSESWIEHPDEVISLEVSHTEAEKTQEGTFKAPNLATLIPTWNDREIHTRPGPVATSCGVCGKRTVEEVLSTLPEFDPDAIKTSKPISIKTLLSLPVKLREKQEIFEKTGALHAAGIFDPTGTLLTAREDIGRHNAVDKAIGHLVRTQFDELQGKILVVSGRVSFEIVQKALRAQFQMVVSVSGVSSLAIDLARCGGLSLCGFTRENSLSIYTHSQRVTPAEME